MSNEQNSRQRIRPMMLKLSGFTLFYVISILLVGVWMRAKCEKEAEANIDKESWVLRQKVLYEKDRNALRILQLISREGLSMSPSASYELRLLQDEYSKNSEDLRRLGRYDEEIDKCLKLGEAVPPNNPEGQ